MTPPSLASDGVDNEAVISRGFLSVRDNTRLHYTLHVPPSGGPFPSLLLYSGYGDLSPILDMDSFIDAGYAVVLVTMRGVGCSEGEWDPFSPVSAQDGYDAVEWIASQPWSTGSVGMIGGSYGGIVQPYVAALRPPHLRAIAADAPFADLYRDVAYPGGIRNDGVLAFFAGSQAAFSLATVAVESAGDGDATECARHLQRRPGSLRNNPLLIAKEHPFIDDFVRSHSSSTQLDDIEVPVFAGVQAPDGLVGARFVNWLPEPYYLYFTNVGNAELDRNAEHIARRLAFLDRFVKSLPNGFERTPHFTIGWETQNDLTPRWATTSGAWPPPGRPRRYFLAEGTLLPTAPAGAGADSYLHHVRRADASGNGSLRLAGNDLSTYAVAPPASSSLVDTSPALDADVVTAGTASVDLWLASTANDTDLQVALSEVQPDGQEMFVQRGFLRASHRALDSRPVHTHLAQDVRPLKAREPELVRVAIEPFAAAFRTGSRIRLRISAPSAWWQPPQDYRRLDALPGPMTNSVLRGAARPSSLVLPVVEGARAGAPLRSTCTSQRGRACRRA